MVFATCRRARQNAAAFPPAPTSRPIRQQQAPQHFGARRAAWLARPQHRQAQSHQRIRQQARLGGLAGAFAALQRDERLAQLPVT